AEALLDMPIGEMGKRNRESNKANPVQKPDFITPGCIEDNNWPVPEIYGIGSITNIAENTVVQPAKLAELDMSCDNDESCAKCWQQRRRTGKSCCGRIG